MGLGVGRYRYCAIEREPAASGGLPGAARDGSCSGRHNVRGLFHQGSCASRPRPAAHPPGAAPSCATRRQRGAGDCACANAVVPGRHRGQRCARSRARRLHVRRPAADRPIAEAFRRMQRSPQGRSLPLRDVDADVLHQSGGETARGSPASTARAGEGGAPKALRQAAPDSAALAPGGALTRHPRRRFGSARAAGSVPRLRRIPRTVRIRTRRDTAAARIKSNLC